MEYEIVVAFNRQEIMRTVRQMISIGWRPLGGIAISEICRDPAKQPMYAQAMVRPAPESGVHA